MNSYGNEKGNLNDLYVDLVKDIYNRGTTLTKQNGTILKEIVPATIEISDPYYGIITHPYRHYNAAFMIAECLWNLSGDYSDWLADYNEKYRKYFIDGKLEAGYGSRIINGKVNQLREICNLLNEHPDSSRGTISIFNPIYDYMGTNFVPCISFLKFRILGDNKLYMWSFMRAQDIWKGFPYDIFLLLSIFQYMSSMLGIEMGSYYHICDTIRLYQDDMKDIENFLLNADNKCEPGKIKLDDCNKPLNHNNIINYRNLVKSNIIDISLLNGLSEFWKNSILTCWVYKKVKALKYNEAFFLYKNISNEFRYQIFSWSSRYNKQFFSFLKDNK